jgi:3-hydroxyisobutyrate dehydrogenase-like beta-hydroxyacid dehydrogenase
MEIVGFIGLGAMGGPVADISTGGYPLVVYDVGMRRLFIS